jgi:hypothetical protein
MPCGVILDPFLPSFLAFALNKSLDKSLPAIVLYTV